MFTQFQPLSTFCQSRFINSSFTPPPSILKQFLAPVYFLPQILLCISAVPSKMAEPVLGVLLPVSSALEMLPDTYRLLGNTFF